MNEKERIIELVKQQVITMDEALRLLEASAQAKSADQAEEPADAQDQAQVTDQEAPSKQEAPADQEPEQDKKAGFDPEQLKATVQEAIDKSLKFGQEIIYSVQQSLDDKPEDKQEASKPAEPAPEASQPEASISQEEEEAAAAKRQELEASLEKEGQALLIAKQRLREFEILAELDELSEELQAQKDQVAAEVLERGQKIDQLQEELKAYKPASPTSEPFSQRLNDFVRQVNEGGQRAADHVSRAADQFGQKADRAGQRIDNEANRLGRVIGQVVSTAFKAAREGIRVGVRAYGRLGNEWEHTFNFDAKDLKVLDFKLSRGDVTVTRAHVDQVSVNVKASFFGKIPNPNLEDFQAHSILSLDDGSLLLQVTDDHMSADIEVTLPDQDLETVRIETTQGDIELDGIQAKEIYLTTVNGDVDLSDVTADLLDYHSTNGDLDYRLAEVKRLNLETTNGDCRVVGAIGDVAASLISGDLLLTKRDETPASMKVSTVSGDVKIAIPANLSLEGSAQSSSGDVEHRIGHLDVETHRHHSLEFQRLMTNQERPVHLEINTVSGDIRLKDTDL
ncbi:DUF4097 family beta strand repeat-containing protein [uncultured Abiotrophia sp.]|uniref:DUF4097 family beta strand repeat-containing protein n=1 Tax=uncultured Abiotrophia sp. TaxID=316094 RepID=UPI0026333693|nr:DUF4097 family beta strand repeat-containing protein [uncultured Abiotrophia sp.]